MHFFFCLTINVFPFSIPQVQPMSAQFKFTAMKSWERTSGAALQLENRRMNAINVKCPRICRWRRESLSDNSTWGAQSCWSSKHRNLSSEFKSCVLTHKFHKSTPPSSWITSITSSNYNMHLILSRYRFKLSPGETVQLGDSLGCFSDDETDSGMESEE